MKLSDLYQPTVLSTRRPPWFCSLQILSCLLPSEQTRQHYLVDVVFFLPFTHVYHEKSKRKTQKIVYTGNTSKVRVLLFFVIPCGFQTWYRLIHRNCPPLGTISMDLAVFCFQNCSHSAQRSEGPFNTFSKNISSKRVSIH